MMKTQNATTARGYSAMNTKVKAGYDVSCAGSGHAYVVLTPKLRILYIISATRELVILCKGRSITIYINNYLYNYGTIGQEWPQCQ
jgi:hypothetical protein